MKEIDYLKIFHDFLQEGEMDAAVLSGTSDVPYDRLLIYTGRDYRDRERIMETTAEIQQMGQNSGAEYLRVQFQVTLPFKVDENASNDTASLLHFLNKLLELPGWEFNELENALDFRYVLLAKGDSIDTKLFGGIVGMILLILQLFTEVVEQVALGERTFNDLLEEIVAIANKMEKN